MPDSFQGWLSVLGSLLPTRLRELVFEPACYDMARLSLERNRSTRRLFPHMMAVLFYVALANFPRVLVENRRPSRLGVIVGTVVGVPLVLFAVGAVLMRARYTY